MFRKVVLALAASCIVATDPYGPVTEIVDGDRLRGSVSEDMFTCFHWRVDDSANPPEHMFIRVNHDNENADPDLYVRKDSLPTREQYIAEDHSTLQLSGVAISSELAGGSLANTDWYACVYGYDGETQFSIELKVTQCPSTWKHFVDNDVFPDRTTMTECSGHGTCDASAHQCQCYSGYNLPGNAECSSEVHDISLSGDMTHKTETTLMEGGGWEYYHITLNDADRELVIEMSRLGNVGDPDIYVRFGTPPTRDKYDLRDISIESEHIVRARKGATDYFSTDVWVGIYAVSTTGYSLTAKVNICPNDCSGHGTCNKATALCSCDEGWKVSGIFNCSMSSNVLEHAGDMELVQVEAGSFAYFEMLIDQSISANHVEVELAAQWTGKAPYEWQTDLPLFLIRHGTELPTPTMYDYQLQLTGNDTNLFLMPASKVLAGSWKMAIWNPLSWNVMTKVQLKFQSYCPNNCNNNGVCDLSGVCKCQEGFIGADCVEIPPHKASVKSGTIATIAIFMFIGGAAIATGGLWYYIRNVNPHFFSGGVSGFSQLGNNDAGFYDPPSA